MKILIFVSCSSRSFNSIPSLQGADASAHHHPCTPPYLVIKLCFHVKPNEGADLHASQPNNVFEVPAGYTTQYSKENTKDTKENTKFSSRKTEIEAYFPKTTSSIMSKSRLPVKTGIH